MAIDPRTELAAIAASLRGYLEWHEHAGSVGFPRRTSTARAVALATTPEDAAPRSPEPPPRSAPAAEDPAVDPRPVATSPPVPEAAASAGAPPDPRVRLSQLASEVEACRRCPLGSSRTQSVFARGNPQAALCFVGEAPGADEDAKGLPFVGRAGQLLDRMIAAMDLSSERDVYVCNIIKCRPPANRRPEATEIAACIPYLHEQLALVHPRVIVALGNTAVAALLETTLGVTKIRGQWKLYRGRTLVMPTYHPSYLLRPGPQQLEAKRQAWQDLQTVMKELELKR